MLEKISKATGSVAHVFKATDVQRKDHTEFDIDEQLSIMVEMNGTD